MELLRFLTERFGYASFRKGQQEIIQSILKGENVIAILPTGAGKSLCYQFPAILGPNFSIVISPLIALMKDQTDSLNKNGKVAAFINSSLSYRETEEVFSELSSGKLKLLYVAPERLESRNFLERIKNYTPDYLFVDEAHCISEWGHNFRPSYQKIRDFAEQISLKRISAFTATATPEVIVDIKKQLNLISPKVYVKGFERDNILIKVIQTSRNKETLFDIITKHKGSAIVYASSRKNAEEAAGYLKANKINAEFYHAGLSSVERKRIQELFIEDKIGVICATNAFGMGIDKPNIRLIVHYNMPGNIESFYQEIGRAGRDGKISRAFLLYNASDISIHKFFINNAYPTREQIGIVYNMLCDSAGIPLGKTSETDIHVDTGRILKHFNRGTSPSIILSALRVLEASGYTKIINAYEGKSVLKIDYSPDSLKSYVKNYAGDTSKEIIISLLREFGGNVFNSKAEFSLSGFAKKLELSEDSVNQELLILSAAGIISYYTPPAGKSMRLLQPRIPASMLIINYENIAQRVAKDLDKLNKMIDFVYTGDCRFNYIINYFGEKNESYKCGSCDNCAGDNFNKTAELEYLREIVIRTVYETKGKLNGKDIIGLLLGKTGNVYLASYPDYGSCSNYNESEMQVVLDSAIQMEYITRENVAGEVSLTAKGMEFLKKTGYIAEENKTINYEYNLELYHKLNEIRKNAAKRFMQTVYLICPDDVLKKVIEKTPIKESEILSIPGFNQRMFNKIGREFLEEIREFKRFHEVNVTGSLYSADEGMIKTGKLLEMGYSFNDISRLRNITEAELSKEIITLIELNPELDISNLYKTGELEKIYSEIRKGYIDLKELKNRLDSNFTYSKIRIAEAKYKLLGS